MAFDAIPWPTLTRPDMAHALLGPPSTWSLRPHAQRLRRDLPARLRDLRNRKRCDRPNPEDRPVFLLSAGWRSGSTLL